MGSNPGVHAADALIEGERSTQAKVVTHVSIQRLNSITELFDEQKLISWNADQRWKVFIIGFPCEAGHKNLVDGRIGVQ